MTPNIFKKRMFELGMNQSRLADLIGRSDAYISAIVNYRRQPRSEGKIILAKALKCGVSELWPVLQIEE
jgi:plasmid maintenance system antidote protein VapI